MYQLSAKIRKIIGKKVKTLRAKDLIPAIVYGRGIKPIPLTVSAKEFEKIYKQAGETDLIELKIDDKKPVNVLIHDVQFHPLTDKIIHVDFYQIKKGEKIAVNVKINLIGQAPAVREKDGILVPQIDELEIECLPQDIPHSIEVDVSNLKEIGDLIRVKDLNISKKLKVLTDPEDIIVVVEALKKEEVAKPTEEEVLEKPIEAKEIKEKEVEGKKKEEIEEKEK